jgi:hypothetical protein
MRLGHVAGWFAAASLGLGTFTAAQSAPPPGGEDRDRPPPPATQPAPPRGDRGGPGFGRRGFGGGGGFGGAGPRFFGGGGFGFMRPGAVRAEKHLWLGVAVSPVPPVVAHQLKLPEGVGLVVDEVMPESPAAKAGLKEYDVLHKLDDQLLVNPEQLQTLVRMHKPGDQVTLNVFHDGESTDLKATVQEGGLPRMVPFGGPRREPSRPPEDGAAPPRPPRPPAPPRGPSDRGPRLEELFRQFHIPEIKARIDGGDLIIQDQSGHTLFEHPLDLDIDGAHLPFSVHVHAKAHRDHHNESVPAPGDAPGAEPQRAPTTVQ